MSTNINYINVLFTTNNNRIEFTCVTFANKPLWVCVIDKTEYYIEKIQYNKNTILHFLEITKFMSEHKKEIFKENHPRFLLQQINTYRENKYHPKLILDLHSEGKQKTAIIDIISIITKKTK